MSDQTHIIEIEIWSDPVWPMYPEFAALNLPTKINELSVSSYLIEMRLVGVMAYAGEGGLGDADYELERVDGSWRIKVRDNDEQ